MSGEGFASQRHPPIASCSFLGRVFFFDSRSYPRYFLDAILLERYTRWQSPLMVSFLSPL